MSAGAPSVWHVASMHVAHSWLAWQRDALAAHLQSWKLVSVQSTTSI
jgi:hypothetical protein